MVTKKEIEYASYGKCLEIENGLVRLIVTLDVGPRIIHFSLSGGKNIMFEDNERVFFKQDAALAEKFGDSTWFTYGGHRLWTSPEAFPRTYYPDNEPVACSLTEQGAIFTPPMQKWNQYTCALEIAMADNTPDVTVIHRVTNHAAWDVTLAPWGITVLASGGTEIIPQPTRDTGLLSNRLVALWPYAKMNDPRVTWGDRYITLRQDGVADKNCKLGITSQHGYAMYFKHGDLFIKRFTPVVDGSYPDGGMSFETYTNRLFLEMESLGELRTLAPEETAEHTERWSLYREALPNPSEDAIDQVVKKYVG
ncbi:MAG: hypothetical protein ACI4QW_00350 [Clostridia bacterium]